jgi:hypothetical protein
MKRNTLLDDLDYQLESNKKELYIENITKFTIFYLLTFGLYGIWWMYKSWCFFRIKDNLSICPIIRSFFSFIYSFLLFKKINYLATNLGYKKALPYQLLYFIHLIFNLLSSLPNPYWLVSILAIFSFFTPIKALNFIYKNLKDYRVIESNGLNGKEVLLLLFSALIWFLLGLELFN